MSMKEVEFIYRGVRGNLGLLVPLYKEANRTLYSMHAFTL